MGKIDEKRAQTLINIAIGQSIQAGGLSRASEGKVWVLAIDADPDGTVRTVLSEDDYDTTNQLLGGRLSKDEWTLWTKPGPTLWVLSLLCESGEVYACAKEFGLLHDPDARRCLFFDEDDTQCGKPATFVCLNPDGLQWTACPGHADSHPWLRMDLETMQRAARAQLSTATLWQAGPGSSEEVRRIAAKLVQSRN